VPAHLPKLVYFSIVISGLLQKKKKGRKRKKEEAFVIDHK
jgi:hypothetical protein